MSVGGSWQYKRCTVCQSLQSWAGPSFAGVLRQLIAIGVMTRKTPPATRTALLTLQVCQLLRAQVPSHAVQDVDTQR